ncbi:MAG: branched-chain amino acid ABC transporter permease [Deltaproteobacteria bacterium]|jgi:branched-chain amino acid transport system permease protein|nr:branched-chain amino acid ABC transporter permease [Deltaproteobacteria bacterium]
MYQVFIYSILAAAKIMLVAIGFAIVFRATRFFHFAHGIVFTAGAYFTFLFKAWLGFPLFFSILLAIPLTTLLGCLMEVIVYLPLRRKGSSSLVFLLASLGMYIVLQNVISMMFGDDTKTIRSGLVKEGLNVFGARITPIEILIICVSVVLVVTVTLLLKKTKMGNAMRAVANDIELASVSGIDSDRVILLTFAIASTLAGIAGILVALDVDMTPTMGMNALMMGVVAVIVGGVGSIPGVALAALLLGIAQHLGVWFISSQWQDAIAFVILLIFLLFRPQGFLGKKVKKATL